MFSFYDDCAIIISLCPLPSVSSLPKGGSVQGSLLLFLFHRALPHVSAFALTGQAYSIIILK